MVDYITQDDLDLINFCLNRGDDVLIKKLSKDKAKIIANTPKAMKLKTIENVEED